MNRLALALLISVGCLLPERVPAREISPEHALFSALLNTHVHDGLVDYRSLRQDQRLEAYIRQLRLTDPEALSGPERKAFFINAYNAFTLQLIVRHYPIESINELHLTGNLYIAHVLNKTVWQTHTFSIFNRDYTLDEIEHDILRPEFRDFRIHAAIVCASMSCPPLRNEAYTPERLDAQLDDQMRIWLSQPHKNRLENGVLYLSAIFDWFRADFEQDGHTLMSSIATYAPETWRSVITQTESTEIEIEFLDFDWSLNDWSASNR
ncbi:MAG: DUF547 domain-containing protein [Leptospiraceae bacterium]|nr:DUF547 domain-containing protein [Leptospiraceae bacterium]